MMLRSVFLKNKNKYLPSIFFKYFAMRPCVIYKSVFYKMRTIGSKDLKKLHIFS